ncbi:MAG TPA: hypothetical protein PL048_08625 [Leptospiraceae bacterium]|nr:hypothetical protein [Leptospiraceae bacterium]HNN06257.1 hypothetical protein [Leptospiraceae bacterium]HNO22922.1 hypothetical protein [Leptospiraceae bacterium]
MYFSCIDDNQISAWESTKRLFPIVEAKAEQCGNRPSYPLLFIRKSSKSEIEQCEREMLAARCPFKAYPWSCQRLLF